VATLIEAVSVGNSNRGEGTTTATTMISLREMVSNSNKDSGIETLHRFKEAALEAEVEE
jgi:hypothetical protein